MKFEDLKGLTLVAITVSHDTIIFEADDRREFKLYHEASCCESVSIEEIVGDISDLLDTPLLEVEEVEHDQNKNPEGVNSETSESFTWTFYKMGTIKGRVTLRWLGTSNGYYAENVSFCEIKMPGEM